MPDKKAETVKKPERLELSPELKEIWRENWGFMPLVFEYMEEYAEEQLKEEMALPIIESVRALENVLVGCWVSSGHAQEDGQEGWSARLDEFFRPDIVEWQVGLVRAVCMWQVWRVAPHLFPKGCVPGAREAYAGAEPLT